MTPAESAALEARIHKLNAVAKVLHTDHSRVDLDKILNVRAFNTKHATDTLAASSSSSDKHDGEVACARWL